MTFMLTGDAACVTTCSATEERKFDAMCMQGFKPTCQGLRQWCSACSKFGQSCSVHVYTLSDKVSTTCPDQEATSRRSK